MLLKVSFAIQRYVCACSLLLRIWGIIPTTIYTHNPCSNKAYFNKRCFLKYTGKDLNHREYTENDDKKPHTHTQRRYKSTTRPFSSFFFLFLFFSLFFACKNHCVMDDVTQLFFEHKKYSRPFFPT